MHQALQRATLMRYAIFGIPLGFISLPLYVHLPKYYADTLTSSLATIGAVMFFARIFDSVADPWIGHMIDRWSRHRSKLTISACITLSLGVCGLFQLPSIAAPGTELIWLTLLLTLTYLSYSVLMIYFYASGLALSADPVQTTRISAWREGAMIIGVLVASALPSVLMIWVNEISAYQVLSLVFVLTLVVAAIITLRRPHQRLALQVDTPSHWRELIHDRPLRWIFALFFLNAIPSSITATLFLFFTADILLQPALSGGFLLLYFLSAILSMPCWTYLSRRMGKRRTLMLSMAVAIMSFVWAYGLGAGDSIPFAVICLLSGLSLGGDATLLPSILADVIRKRERSGGLEFGIWNFISKFTLALAAGIALPALYYLGYSPNVASSQGLHALSLGYALLPCVFKCAALILLVVSPIDNPRRAL